MKLALEKTALFGAVIFGVVILFRGYYPYSSAQTITRQSIGIEVARIGL
jgi:hypothetical protein